jgi:hypothetical protein
MLRAVKLLIAISYASLVSCASTFVPKIWHVGFDVRPVRVITLFAFLIAAITARILLGAAIHRDNVARGIVAPFPYTTYPGIDSPGMDRAHRKTG